MGPTNINSENLSEKAKILCIDDEESIIKALQRVLSRHFDVATATSAEDAIELIKTNHDYSVILSDLHLPKMNGVELLKQAKQISPSSTRAILSGQIDLRQMMEAINNADIDRFIMKPWDNEYLELQMLEALKRHTLISEKIHLQHLATTDAITGLTNHRFFQDNLKKELERAARHDRKFTLLMFDIDYFKNFNDLYGHQQGDKVLHTIAQATLKQIRLIDSASRYGGEEFVVILPDTEIQSGFDVAERIRKAIESLTWDKPISGNVTISIGTAEYPTHGVTSSELISSADQAMYKAKNAGRNQSVLAG